MRLLLASLTAVVMSGVLYAQGAPTDTPTIRALTALLPLRDQARYGQWLQRQAGEAKFAEWLTRQDQQSAFARRVAVQQKDAGKAVFASYLGQPGVLLGARSTHDRPNYGGNAFESIRHDIWLRVARGQALGER